MQSVNKNENLLYEIAGRFLSLILFFISRPLPKDFFPCSHEAYQFCQNQIKMIKPELQTGIDKRQKLTGKNKCDRRNGELSKRESQWSENPEKYISRTVLILYYRNTYFYASTTDSF